MKAKHSPDWLLSSTGLSLPDWMIYIQKRIVKRSRPSKDPNHDQTDAAAWVADLEKAIEKSWKKADEKRAIAGRSYKVAVDEDPLNKKTFKPKPKPFDGNMRMAATMGMILCAWYCAVQLAKTHDPNRPVKLRREAYDKWCGWYQAQAIALIDARHDYELFPGQEWESPFMPGARDGKFV